MIVELPLPPSPHTVEEILGLSRERRLTAYDILVRHRLADPANTGAYLIVTEGKRLFTYDFPAGTLVYDGKLFEFVRKSSLGVNEELAVA